MKRLKTRYRINKKNCFAVISLLLLFIFPKIFQAQTDNQSIIPDISQAIVSKIDGDDKVDNKNFIVNKDFRVEKIPVQGGAEIITIFANLKGLSNSPADKIEEVPLVSILRDTLGDDKVENDQLRYVWMLTYTKPSLSQKFSAFIPFLYTRTTNKSGIGNEPPPPIIDLNPAKSHVWDKVFWYAFRNLILDDFGFPLKAATLQYKANIGNYRKSAVARALAILSLYEAVEGKKILNDTELKDIQARLLIADKPLGSFMQSENLQKIYQKQLEKNRNLRGHNWELLRQYSEAQGLYFEPLEMTAGSPTHALVWVSATDLVANKDKKFNSRFLNIKNPWDDARLVDWQGYSEIRWFDSENRQVSPDTPNATAKTMIPLALYGLDYPKIPTLLVDFRDRDNPKRREMSRRILDDLTKNVLSISKFDDLPYFVGRYVYDFVTGRRGMDVNQISRVSSYSQLKLLLSLNASLDPKFRTEIANRLEYVSLNPLEKDLADELKLARQQYQNLMEYAKNSDGLSAKIEKDRHGEMTNLKHNGGKRMLYTLGNIFSFGLYEHREKDSPELRNQMDLKRQLAFHERFLREVARTSINPEVDNDINAINRSLNFMAQNGTNAQPKTAQAIAKIFAISENEQTRLLALNSLYRINNSTAKKEMLGLYNNEKVDTRWRNMCAEYLKLAIKEEQRISLNDAKTISKF